MQIRAH